jgi:hypothetical protein
MFFKATQKETNRGENMAVIPRGNNNFYLIAMAGSLSEKAQERVEKRIKEIEKAEKSGNGEARDLRKRLVDVILRANRVFRKFEPLAERNDQ